MRGRKLMGTYKGQHSLIPAGNGENIHFAWIPDECRRFFDLEMETVV